MEDQGMDSKNAYGNHRRERERERTRGLREESLLDAGTQTNEVGIPQMHTYPTRVQRYTVVIIIFASLFHGLSEVHHHDIGLFNNSADNVGSTGHGGTVHDTVVSAPAKVANLLLDNIVVLVKRRDGAHAANAQDSDLALNNDGAEVCAANVANVGHGDSAAGHIRGRKLALHSERLETGQLLGNGDNVERADVLDDGDHEARGRVHGNTDVVLRSHDEAGLVGLGVNLYACIEDRELVEGQRNGLDDEGEVGDLGQLAAGGRALGEDLVEARAEVDKIGKVNLVGVEEVRDGKRAAHGLEHALLHHGQRLASLDLHGCVLGQGGRSSGRGISSRLGSLVLNKA